MKKTTYLVVLCLSFISFSYGQYTAIPDAQFEQELINAGIDTGSLDGQILTSVANAYSGIIIVNNKGINDLTGIEAFTSITGLEFGYNLGITSVDLSGCTALQTVDGRGCLSMTSVNLNGLVNLTEINFKKVGLTSLDVSTNSALSIALLRINNLSYMDFSQNSALTVLDVKNNNLTFLDMRNGNNAHIDYFNSDYNSNLDCILIDDISTPDLPFWIKDLLSCFCEDPGVCLTVSVDEVQKLSFNMYPNPTTDSIYVSALKNNSFLSIYNIMGKEVFNKSLIQGENLIDISGLPSGIYVAKFTSGKQVDTKKLIIQ
ncbi:T9SS type A sorting domain-containing protein [Xanthomarina sp. F1114]|uniref:T9SS type A sorting domain-containing protein n=1 Tax=Xanthomarina sp. F1114 TaxID=2996019 RepID=UPI00225E1456|nr:T9SS type A sorting domain-containing protein [Xanthomarina sp. F1114]MCX7547012.1 T9SS type A sorting domain-containing protein [Xanthomarina sp. F1114]